MTTVKHMLQEQARELVENLCEEFGYEIGITGDGWHELSWRVLQRSHFGWDMEGVLNPHVAQTAKNALNSGATVGFTQYRPNGGTSEVLRRIIEVHTCKTSGTLRIVCAHPRERGKI